MIFKKLIFIIITLAFLLPTARLLAEELPSRASFFLLYNSWKRDFTIGEENINEGVGGLKIIQQVSEIFNLELISTFSNAKYNNRTTDFSFSALNDTRLKGTILLADKLISGTVLANIPTGKKKLSDEQYTVSLLVADKSRRFAVRRFGEGLDLGTEWYLQPVSGNTTFHLGGGFLKKGKYQFLASNPSEYKFGDEYFAKVGFETKSDLIKYYLSLQFKAYGKDELAAKQIFQAGNAFSASGSISYYGSVMITVGGSFIYRNNAKIPASEGEGFSEETLKSGRDELFVHFDGAVPLGATTWLLIRTEYNLADANEYNKFSQLYRPKANYFGVGGGISQIIATQVSVSAIGTYFNGKMDSNLIDKLYKDDLSGLGAAMILTIHY